MLTLWRTHPDSSSTAPGTATGAAKLPWLIAVEGATAVGKTSLAISLAKAFQTHIVSADARQCYREMAIGVARPSDEELAAVPHHFIADRSIQNPLSAGAYEREGLALLRELFRRQGVVILAGGSGLYVNALLQGLDHFPPVASDIQQQLQAQLEQDGLPALLAQLEHHDPVYAAAVDPQNPHRILRALSVSLSAGKPYSSFRSSNRPSAERPFNTLRLVLERDRDDLYHRINARVEAMMRDGLLAEAKALLPYRHLTALDTVGYRESFGLFDQAYDQAECVRLIQRNTRRYAKRQMTWLRRQSSDCRICLPSGEQPLRLGGLLGYLRARTGWPS